MPTAPQRHKAPQYSKHHRKPEHRRDKRKYSYRSKQWQSIRAKQLSISPICVHCATADRLTPATDVDHIDGDSWNNDTSNLQSLCHSCHSRKTYEQDGAFGNAIKRDIKP